MSDTITVPHNFSPRYYQEEFLSAPQRFKIGVFHRRGGKSMMAVNAQIARTQWPELAGKTFYYFLPTYASAKRIVWDKMIKEHVPLQLVKKINESELAIYWKNGSIQRFVGCEDWIKHKGIDPIDVVLDEFQEIDERMWFEVCRPILGENGGTATIIGTPKGKNHFWKILNIAKDDPKNWFYSIKTVNDTKGITEDELEQIKAETPQAMFEQEYYCKFTDNAGAFFRNIKACTYKDFTIPEPNHSYQLGIDLAKYNDYTVLTPFDLNTFKVYPQERFNMIDYNLQKARIEATALRLNNAQLKIDKTGVGDPVVEDLSNRGLNISQDDAITFTQKRKEMLLRHLAILIEQGKIKLPYDEGLISELESVQYSYNSAGKMMFGVPSGMHDDRVMSLALAVDGAEEPLGTFYLDNNGQTSSRSKEEDLYEAI